MEVDRYIGGYLIVRKVSSMSFIKLLQYIAKATSHPQSVLNLTVQSVYQHAFCELS